MSYVQQVAIVLGVLAGAVTALGVLWKSPIGRLGRWLYKRLFGEPVADWFRTQVGREIDTKLLVRNGGTTVPDAIHRIDALRDDLVPRLEAIERHIKGDS